MDPIKKCFPEDVEQARKAGNCQIVDVREGFELDLEKIPHCLHLPLTSLNPQCLDKLEKDKPIYLVCKSGSRSMMAAEKLKNYGCKELYVLEGGLEAWRKSGRPVIKSLTKTWALERQVRFTAGSLILAGIILSWTIHPAFLFLSAFVGAELVFSGITDTCGMGLLLAKMPWNRSVPSSSC